MFRTGAEVMDVQGRRARGLARLTVLCLPVAAALVLPSAAIAAAGGSTVRATVGGDGAVQSVKVYTPGGGISSFNGQLPIKVSISRTVSGGTSTYTYHVENTFSKTQPVTYKDTSGKTHVAVTDLQLPLVAQLGVELPKTFKDVNAPQGVVETNPDGINRVLYQLVLFSPLGSPTQDVTFTATGSGAPTMELSAVAVNPSTTSGLSQSGQDSNASAQQDDFWAGFANGGNGGLTQLAAGMGQLVAGLQQATPGAHQLADGLAAAGDGAKQLDAGTAKAAGGAHTLSSGIGQIHAGQSQLTGGLGQIAGGLGQLTDPTTGLPAAIDGIDQLDAGVKAIIAGVGSVSTPQTLLFGVNAIEQGTSQILAGFTNPSTGIIGGLTCAQDLINATLTGRPANTPDPCFDLFGIPTTNPVNQVTDATVVAPLTAAKALVTGVLNGINGQVVPGLTQIRDGAHLVLLGLSHPVGAGGANDKGGVLEGLKAIDAGLGQLKAGASTAVAGAQALEAGAVAAHSGSQKLTTGSGDAFTGSKELASGLDQLSAGQHQVATGLPAAVTGSAQLASGMDQLSSGATQINDGIKAVQSQAVQPLLKQLQDGALNAKKQLAILDAATALAAQSPGGQGTSYVLTQSKTGFRLAAATTSSSGSSDTARNVGIGLGGLVVLILAVTAGFALGRRSGRVTV